MAVGYNPRIVTDGLVLALDAGNTKSYPGSGSTWTDLIGGRGATLTGSPTHTENYLSFDGSTQYASFSSSVEVSTAGFTMAFLIDF